MSDPIGAAVARAWQGTPSPLQGGLDTGARQFPVLPESTGGESFGDTLTKAINSISQQQDHAASSVQAFLRGDDVELHQVMAAAEEAQISLEMLVEVRNKFAEAYRTLTTMQG